MLKNGEGQVGPRHLSIGLFWSLVRPERRPCLGSVATKDPWGMPTYAGASLVFSGVVRWGDQLQSALRGTIVSSVPHLPERQWRRSWESTTRLPNFKPSVQSRAQRLRLAALWLIELGERKVPVRMPAVLAMSVCPVIAQSSKARTAQGPICMCPIAHCPVLMCVHVLMQGSPSAEDPPK